MNADSYTVEQLQKLIKAGEKQYKKAIEIDKEFEEAKTIFLKIKELKKALDAKNIGPNSSQYFKCVN